MTGSGGMFKSDVHLRVLESTKDASSNSPSAGFVLYDLMNSIVYFTQVYIFYSAPCEPLCSGTHVVLHSDHMNAAIPSVGDLEKALPEYGPKALIVSGLRATVGVHNTDQTEIKVSFDLTIVVFFLLAFL